jgi:FkbM family methyltransferase
VLRALCRLPIPGRYFAVQTSARWLTSEAPVLARAPNGLEVELDLRDDLQRLVFFGLYEAEETRFFLSRVKRGDIVMDVGANVGYYALLASTAVGPDGMVHAFEPIPGNARALTRNVERCGIENVKINVAAVSDGSARELTLYMRAGASNSGWASIAKSATRENAPITVPAITIDEYVQKERLSRVDLVKLDVEGAEANVLRGGRTTFTREDAPDLICEINPFLLHRTGSTPAALVEAVRAFGYDVYDISARGATPFRGTVGEEVRNLFASKRSQR